MTYRQEIAAWATRQPDPVHAACVAICGMAFCGALALVVSLWAGVI